jgi:hypothetical protein
MKKKSPYRISNWSEYNASLKQQGRGAIGSSLYRRTQHPLPLSTWKIAGQAAETFRGALYSLSGVYQPFGNDGEIYRQSEDHTEYPFTVTIK